MNDIESRGHVRSDGVIAGGGAGNLLFFLEVATNVGDWSPTVDGSEIRRSPVEVGSLSHFIKGISTIPGGCSFGISEPSTVSGRQGRNSLMKFGF